MLFVAVTVTPMFSLHIDTARTWRGGQNQVLLTVNGLRSIGRSRRAGRAPRRRAPPPRGRGTRPDSDRAAHRDGPVRRLAPLTGHPPARLPTSSTPMTRTASRWPRWRCRWARRPPTRAGGRAPALVAARRVDFHLRGNSLSRWKQRQVDCFIAASEAIRQMLVADGVPARAHDHRARRHRRRARRSPRRRSTCTKRSGCRTTRRSSATSRRSCRTRASAISSTPRIWSCARFPTRGSSSSARASCATRSSARSASIIWRSTCCCRASGPTCSAASRASTCSR